MGMDVYGKNPTAEVGQYFRNSVWGWHPLADYLTAAHPALTAGCTYWHSNDGDGLDDAGALALADALDLDLANGTVALYEAERSVYLAALPMEECWLCSGTGVRTDEIGVQNGLDKPRDPVTGRGGCNACSGTGQTEPTERHYPFEVANVAEFARFARHSGGFEIW